MDNNLSVNFPSPKEIEDFPNKMFDVPYEELDYKLKAHYDGILFGYKAAIKRMRELNAGKVDAMQLDKLKNGTL